MMWTSATCTQCSQHDAQCPVVQYTVACSIQLYAVPIRRDDDDEIGYAVYAVMQLITHVQ